MMDTNNGIIDIKGLSKAEILSKLYNNSRTQGMGIIHETGRNMEREEAQALLDSGQTYFDYVHGRVMKIDLQYEEFDPFLYDRDIGEGEAERIINVIKDTTHDGY